MRLLIQEERVIHILREELRTIMLFGKLVTHSLTIQQEQTRKQISQPNLILLNKSETDFLTMDETKIYHHDHKLKK